MDYEQYYYSGNNKQISWKDLPILKNAHFTILELKSVNGLQYWK